MALYDIYTPVDLYRVMFDPRQTVPTNQWLNMFYKASFLSTTEEIGFSKINASRRIAPFMLPNEPGKPIYRREGEALTTFKPAYTKPKDAVRPGEMLQLQPGELSRREALSSPAGRYAAEVIRIAQFQKNAIFRLWDFMGARALLNGSITIPYQDGPTVTLDFGRDPGHTVTLTGGDRWGQVGVNIVTNLNTWINTMTGAAFGGRPSDIILGASAAVPFLASQDIKDLMNNDFRGSSEILIKRGIITTDPLDPFTYLGQLDTGMNVWMYSGPASKFQNNDGSFTDIMDPRDVLLISAAVEGVKCFGAILDEDAGLQPIDIFTKMWSQPDPSGRFIMSQSAPLMIPVNPNCTFRARVVA